jgi:ATP-dependent Lhr-like helicase
VSLSPDVLGELAGTWFRETFGEPTPAQEIAWPALARGESALVVAPTGSGKTLAAFLVFLDRLAKEPDREREGVRVLYVTPLKALGNDIHRNLEVPLEGMTRLAERLGQPPPGITIGIRSGDTPQKERDRLTRKPPDVLITTPESLYLMLTSERAAKTLASVEAVIVDEVHALAPNKRGTHLALSLERLAWLTGRPFQRIGLSATVRPAERVAAWLSGHERGTARPIQVLDSGGRKEIDLTIASPVEDFRELPGESVWPSIFDELHRLVREHRSTLIFVNNRRLAERAARQINERAGEDLARVHHGSLSREKRYEVEALLKAGKLPAMVSTSSMELGIDIGAIDLVVQIESPKSVTAGLQRVGRAGHLVGEVATGRIIPKVRVDLVDAAAVARGMLRREIETTEVPEGCLDILAQQIAATVSNGEWTDTQLFELARGSYPFRELDRGRFEAVLGMLSGKYPAARFGELRPRVVWNRSNGEVRARPGTRMLAVTNGGAIPDRGYFRVVHSGTGARLGELDEQFVFEARPGDSFLLGSAVWRLEHIDRDEVIVTEAPGAMPTIPFWEGDLAGRPYEQGVRFGEFLGEVAQRLDDPDVEGWLREECALDELAAANLKTFLTEQRDAAGELPTNRKILVEEFDDELGDRRVLVHSPFGSRVHNAWMLVVRARIRDAENLDVEAIASDDGFMLRLPGRDSPVPIDLITQLPGDEELDELLLRELQISPIFGALFRECAARALLLPRRMPDRRTPLWLQRIRAQDLMQLVKRYGEFPILLEAYREAWDDLLRVRDFRVVADGLRSGEIAVHHVASDIPSPFAFHFLFDYQMENRYVGDYPRAEWRTQLLAVDRDLLARVVRPDALRDLLDAGAIQRVEALLQRMDDRSRPRTADELADALTALGDLTDEEMRARAGSRWREMADLLVQDGRAVRVEVGGERRWVPADHAAEYEAMAKGDDSATGVVLRRHLAGHGPVTAAELASRYGLPEAEITAALMELRSDGQVSTGEFRPGGSEREWVDTDNLKRIHRETLQVLRKEIQPVDPERYADFLLAQAVETPGTEAGARLVLERLAGLPVPAAALIPEILSPRFRHGDISAVESLVRVGEYLWQGLPGRRVALFPRSGAERLLRRPAEASGEAAGAVEALLAERGASFLSEVSRDAGLPEPDALKALFALAWAGRVTNDALTGIQEPGRARARRGTRAERLGEAHRIPQYGRWSLLPLPVEDPAEAAEAWAERLLPGYGVVAREVASAADVPVPWPLLVDALTTMEAQGRARRGYFVRALSGIQFALPATVDRLRGEPRSGLRMVAVADPANAYGAILPLASDMPYRPSRVPGSWLVTRDGLPIVAIEAWGRRVIPLSDGELAEGLEHLRELASRRPGGRLAVESWAGDPVIGSAGEALLAAAGFSAGPRRMTYRAPVR